MFYGAGSPTIDDNAEYKQSWLGLHNILKIYHHRNINIILQITVWTTTSYIQCLYFGQSVDMMAKGKMFLRGIEIFSVQVIKKLSCHPTKSRWVSLYKIMLPGWNSFFQCLQSLRSTLAATKKAKRHSHCWKCSIFVCIASHITIPTFNTLIAHFLLSCSPGHDALMSFYKCPMNTNQQKNSIFIEVGGLVFVVYLVFGKKHFMSEKWCSVNLPAGYLYLTENCHFRDKWLS